jgi:hypothetical protein
VYDEVQEEIETCERSLEKELKKLEKQVGSVGLTFQPPSLPHPFPRFSLSYWHSHIGNKVLVFVFQGYSDNGINPPRAGHLPGPDKGQSEERSKGLDQERGYKGGFSAVSATPNNTD